MQTFQLAGVPVDLDGVKTDLAKYAEKHHATVEWYDLEGTEVVQSSNGVSPDDLGRMILINARLTADDCAELLALGPELQWDSIPDDANLLEAEPEEFDGLYAAADALYKSISRPKIRTAKVSKLLHIKRPHLFPILDSRIQKLYRVAATNETAQSKRSPNGDKPMYWAAIRRDLMANTESLDQLKKHFASQDSARVRRLALLPDVRLMDALAWWRA